MNLSIKRLLVVLSVGIAVSLATGCGGGGGSGSADSADTGPTEPPPVNEAPDALNEGLTGKLWFRVEDTPSYYTAAAGTGIETKFVDRPSTDHYLVPSPDGAKYLFHTYDTAAEATDIDVYDADTQELIAAIRVPGWISAYRFSRDGRYLGLLRSPTFIDKTVERGLMVVDLTDPADPQVVREFLGIDESFVLDFDWLQDGQYIYIRRDKNLFVGSAQVAGGNETQSGSVAVPTGFSLGAHLAASPDGTQAALVLNWVDGPLDKSDVWISDIDGTNLQRLSNTGISDEPLWSPDGRYIAMNYDTGHTCQAGGCFGICDRWYAPKEARGVTDSDRVSLRVYESSSVTPEGLWCGRDIFWTN